MINVDLRLLIVAPTGRDGELIKSVLAESAIESMVCGSVSEACSLAREGAAALLMAEEAVSGQEMVEVRELLQQQPEWSDLPVLLLVVGGSESVQVRTRTQERQDLQLNNVTLLERPIRMQTLVSAVSMALRSRLRQYEVRSSLEQRVMVEEAVRRSEKLAVAGRLAASIAHEINNPLEAVTNLLYLIAQSDDLEEIKGLTKTAEQELARVSEIATQTLRFHRQQSKPASTSMEEVLDSVLSLYGSRLMGGKVEVRRSVRSTRPISVYAGEIRQLVANLVQNALDSMPKGGVLHLRLRCVRRHGRLGTSGIRLAVADTGAGIPEHVRKTLFEPFVTTKGATGTGLGLWVSKEIVSKHGGDLRFRSSTGPKVCGTVFSVFLPG